MVSINTFSVIIIALGPILALAQLYDCRVNCTQDAECNDGDITQSECDGFIDDCVSQCEFCQLHPSASGC
jgi:hypothetical protein